MEILERAAVLNETVLVHDPKMPYFGSIRIFVLRPCCSSQRNSCEIRRRATGCILYGQTLQIITVESAEGGGGRDPTPSRGRPAPLLREI